MSRSQQDQFIDDEEEEEVCPLCVEELDLTDKNFRPCPCGYQICQFCYNNIKTTMNGLCPACRRPYDDKNIQYKVVSPEEMAQHRQNLAQQAKKKAAARQKEAQKREADHLSRKHLAGLRVRQKNLVYVTGLKPKVFGEKLVEGLRQKDFFGQYGDIVKIVVSKAKDPALLINAPVGIYITFARKDAAESCIQTVDGLRLPDGSRLRAQYGTTKYCSAYLRGETCTNRSCMFLHEPGDDSESFTRQDLSSLNAISTQQPTLGVQPSQSPQPLAPPQHTHPVAAATQEQGEAIASPMDSPSDGPALPATASWADQARRASRTTSGSAGSPLASNSILATQDAKPDLSAVKDVEERPHSTDSSVPEKSSIAATPSSRKPRKQQFPYFGDIVKTAFNPRIKFDFAFPAHFTEKDKWIVENMPPLFDPNEGTRRRLIKEREIEELQQQAEAQATQSAQPGDLQLQQDLEGDEHVDTAGGSSQLGGEPEERPDRGFAQSSAALSSQQAIGSPTFDLGQGFGDLQGLGSGRVMTPQQSQQQLLLQQLKMASVAPSGPSQQPAAGHGRQNSRFFLNEAMGTASKNFAKQPGSAHYGNALAQNQGQFNYSAVQGPPPGLKATGTPPVSGGGMFGQGHGFTQGGYGGNAPRENDKLWDLHRGRGNVGGGDAGKREFMFPSPYHQYPSTSATTPAQGALSFPYGSQTGAYQESGGLQKQKRKGKKHRHANTSSSGGGVVDVADPSILQMRVGGPMAGQGGFAGQGQEPLPNLSQSGVEAEPSIDLGNDGMLPVLTSTRSLEQSQRTTPTVPPGLSRPSDLDNLPGVFKAAALIAPVRPAIPILPVTPRKPAAVVPKERDQKPAPGEAITTPVKAIAENTSQVVTPNAKASPAIQDVTISETLTKPQVKTAAKDAKSQPNEKTSTVDVPKQNLPMPMPVPKNEKGLKGKEPLKETAEIPKGTTVPFPDRSSKRPHPGKLDISTSSTTQTMLSKIDTLTRGSRAASLTSSLNSRPSTPAAALAGSPMKRNVQPRTLRITETPRSETPPVLPSSSNPPLSRGSVTGSIVSSRRPSLSSTNQPSTPIGERVDTSSLPSASVSRAGSPPPVAGKQRSEKRAKNQRKKDVEEIPLKAAEEQAPVVARKKKTKKPGGGVMVGSGQTSSSTPVVSLPASPGGKKVEKSKKSAERQKTAAVAADEDQPISQQQATTSLTPTNEDLQADPEPPQVKKPEPAGFAFLANVLEDYLNSALAKPISSNAHLRGLESRPFSTPADWAHYLTAQVPFTLSPAELADLSDGRPVRRVAPDGRLSSHVIETMRGTNLRCLTREEEDHLIALEDAVCEVTGPGFWGGGKDYLIPGMLNYEDMRKRQSKAGLAGLPPVGTVLLDGSRDLSTGEDAVEYNNKFVFAGDEGNVQTAGGAVRPAPTQRHDFGISGISGADRNHDTPPSSTAAARPTTPELHNAATKAAAAAAAALGSTAQYLAEVRHSDWSYETGSGGAAKVDVKEAERLMVEEKKQVEALEKKLNSLVKRNRKMLAAGVGGR